MIRPTATYRLQLRGGMTFARAAALAPQLADLGISHLYLSPIFEAVRGSTHGYDIADNTAIASELGSEAGFRALTYALRRHGIGLILDFVPNHMAASPQNPWWRNVLEWGATARHAQHFDIDWSAPKLILPVLARGYGKVLEQGELGLAFNASTGTISLKYFDLALPLTPPSYADILSRAPALSELAQRFAASTPEMAPLLKSALAAAAREPDTAALVMRALDETNAERPTLHGLHERQVWRLTHWRTAREMLTHRRFFEIADLVGLKVELPQVFDDVHACVLGLAKDGSIDGLRLDHIDGLADPKGYLERLQAALGREEREEPFYLLVEKILGPQEVQRQDWPVAGTTGYEFIRALAGLLVDCQGETAMTDIYHRLVGAGSIDYEALVTDIKRRTLTHNLAGELRALTHMAHGLAVRQPATRDLGADTLRSAIVELASALPVYRTYVGPSGPGATDRSILEAAAQEAEGTREVEDREALNFVKCLALMDVAPEDRAEALQFAVRFQQTTGPLMAKAVEDTAFYRYNRLLALNEVGGEPVVFGAPVSEFHRAMIERRQQPSGLSATATHDTKRGEDARARLYALSEMPEAWAVAAARWREQNLSLKRDVRGRLMPDPEAEWAFYQALAGAWPLDLDAADANGLAAFAERMAQFAVKAAREAKLHTSWTAPDPDYEQALERFVRGTLDPKASSAFLWDFVRAVWPIFVAGALNGLTQTLVKMAAPGVPDIYQGTELWDFSMVDPDNRRPIDFRLISHLAARIDGRDVPALVHDWRSGAIKLHLLKTGLRLRAERPALFRAGAYVPLEVAGDHCHRVVALARVLGEDATVAVAPRLALGLLDRVDVPMVPPPRWGSTTVVLPAPLANRRWVDVCTGQHIDAKAEVALEAILHICPVALMLSTGGGDS
jgi:(1->4)-alpha-D-glucan 1-alpha-D-glucosylmutase